MIFLPNKTTKQDWLNKQQGVTLLLAILVLSSIVAISFSFASIILIEIRASGDVTRTEPAYYAAQGIVEQVIFKIKRGVPDTVDSQDDFNFGTCNSNTPVNAGVNPVQSNPVTLTAGICNRNPSATVKVNVPPTASGDPANTSNVYSLYDPNNPYTNTADVKGTAYPSAYSMIEFNWQSSPGAATTIYFCEAEIDCFSTGGWNIKVLDKGNPQIVYDASSNPSIQPDKAYQFFLVNPDPTEIAGVEIKSWGPDPENHTDDPTYVDPAGKGLPSFGQQSVDVTAASQGLTRKYQVSIPNQ